MKIMSAPLSKTAALDPAAEQRISEARKRSRKALEDFEMGRIANCYDNLPRTAVREKNRRALEAFAKGRLAAYDKAK
jgi:vacuolar-type H+-ATPase subunit H